MSLVKKFCQAVPSSALLVSVIIASTALSSCAGINSKKPATDATADTRSASSEPAIQPGESAASEKQTLPDVQLTEELLYKLLLSDIASQQNNNELALAALVDTAMSTRDPRLAAQATRQAVIASQYGIAIQMSRLWLELAPNNLDAHQTLGNLLVVEKNPDQALRHYSKALALADEKNRSQLLKQISNTVVRYSDQQQALNLIEKLATEYPDSADVALAHASVASKLKEYDIAATAIDRTLSLDPKNVHAATFKFGLLLLNKKPDTAEQFAAAFLKKSPEAIKLRSALARHYLGKTDLKLAEKEYLIIHKQDKTSIIAPMALALIRMEGSEFAEATQYLEKVLALQQGNDLARMYLGDIAAEQGNLDDAIQWYRTITNKDQLFKARLRLVDMVMLRDGIEPALREVEAIHAVTPAQQIDVILLNSDLLFEVKRVDQAKQVLTNALKDAPDDLDLLYARAMIAAQQEDVAGLEKDLQHVLRINPRHAQALNAYGFTLVDLTDRYKEGYKLIKMALDVKPGDPFILDSMGWVEYRLGNYDAAEGYLRDALAKRDDSEIAYHLVEVLLAAGKTRDANKVWKKAIKSFPENKKLTELGGRLGGK